MNNETAAQTSAQALQTTEERLAAIEDRLQRGSDRMKSIEDDVAENTVITREIRELLELGRSGLRILGYLGAVAKWAAPIVGLGAAAYGWWQAIKSGTPPTK